MIKLADMGPKMADIDNENWTIRFLIGHFRFLRLAICLRVILTEMVGVFNLDKHSVASRLFQ